MGKQLAGVDFSRFLFVTRVNLNRFLFVCETKNVLKDKRSLNISGETLVKHGYSNPQMIDFRHILLKKHDRLLLYLFGACSNHGKTW